MIVWEAFDSDPRQGLWLKLLLLTGQRSSEVAEMAWGEIDFEEAIWTIPAERTKNGLVHRVPLVGQALAILRSLPRIGERALPRSFQSARAVGADRARKAAGVSFTPHDLRRTVRTYLAELGVDEMVAEKILNHNKKSVAATYNRYSYEKEKRDALLRWDRRLAQILSGSVAKVLEFPAQSA